MKKIALTLTVLATITSAHAATLDVHGDIKVNGKTVITETGEMVQSDAIDVAKYLKAGNGVAVLSTSGTATITRTGDENGLIEMKIQFENQIIESYIDSNGEEVSTPTSAYTVDTTTFTFDGHRSAKHVEYSDGCTSDSTFSVATEFGSILLGESGAAVELYTLSNSCVDSDDVYEYINQESITPLKLTSFTVGSETYDDCLIYVNRWDANLNINTACVGVGLVKSQSIQYGRLENTEQLISFTPN